MAQRTEQLRKKENAGKVCIIFEKSAKVKVGLVLRQRSGKDIQCMHLLSKC